MADTSVSSGLDTTAVHRGPPAGIVATVFVALFVASLVVVGVMTGGARFPTPSAPIELAREYYGRYAEAVRLAAFLQFGSAIPLGIFTATIVSRLNFLGVRVAGVHIALFGGFASSIFLAFSALTGWVLSQPGVSLDTGVLRALQLLAFITGGAGHVVTLGLLLAGVSVTAGFAGLLPRWLVWLGMLVAAIAELSSLSLVFPTVSFLLPLGQFPAFIWLIGTGFTMPKSRAGHLGQSGTAPS